MGRGGGFRHLQCAHPTQFVGQVRKCTSEKCTLRQAHLCLPVLPSRTVVPAALVWWLPLLKCEFLRIPAISRIPPLHFKSDFVLPNHDFLNIPGLAFFFRYHFCSQLTRPRFVPRLHIISYTIILSGLLPSCENATLYNPSICPINWRISCPVFTFQSGAIFSCAFHSNSNLPPGSHPCSCETSVRTKVSAKFSRRLLFIINT